MKLHPAARGSQEARIMHIIVKPCIVCRGNKREKARFFEWHLLPLSYYCFPNLVTPK